MPRTVGVGWKRTTRAGDELAELVGLDLDHWRYPAALSGGQQQRVGVARALAADPPILLMDEPYSAVDPIVRADLQDDLLALQATVRKTIVLVTHDIDEAMKLADQVAIMNVGGVLEQFATPDELLSAPANPFVARRSSAASRGLRRLALRTVADIAPIEGPAVTRDGDDHGRDRGHGAVRNAVGRSRRRRRRCTAGSAGMPSNVRMRSTRAPPWPTCRSNRSCRRSRRPRHFVRRSM